MGTNRYTNGEYASGHPDYHVHDSAFKWHNLRACVEYAVKRGVFDISEILEVAEIGCGAGQVCSAAEKSGLFKNATFYGWDINPDAIELARSFGSNVHFVCGDLLEDRHDYELIICADVLEHVENTFEFLRAMKRRAHYILFNIPLEMNLMTMVRGETPFKQVYVSAGHIHFYNKGTAIRLLHACDLEVLTMRFANNRTSRLLHPGIKLRTKLTAIPQAVINLFNRDISALVFGDSLSVLVDCRT